MSEVWRALIGEPWHHIFFRLLHSVKNLFGVYFEMEIKLFLFDLPSVQHLMLENYTQLTFVIFFYVYLKIINFSCLYLECFMLKSIFNLQICCVVARSYLERSACEKFIKRLHLERFFEFCNLPAGWLQSTKYIMPISALYKC